MHKFRKIALLLLFLFYISSVIPVPAAAASLSGTSGGNLIETFVSFVLDKLFTNVLHMNVALPATPTVSKDKQVLGFYTEWWNGDTSSLDDLSAHANSINTIAPFWATLHADGTVTTRGGKDHMPVVRLAHSRNVTTLLMVNNADQNHPNDGIHAVLSNPVVRRIAINNLEAFIKRYGLDGINIDFEMVPAKDRDNLTAFFRKLSARFKPEGLIVSADVFPKHNEENDVAAAYDYAKLAQYADQIILMTYDYHAGWNGPGAIAGIPYVKRDLKYALKFIPSNKLYLGFAGYGYDWSENGTKSLEYSDVKKLVAKYDPTLQWDDVTESPHFNYFDQNGLYHQVWYENSKSLKYKIDLVNRYDLAGLALWRLGDEDPACWQVIQNNLNN
jgi:spore germination protein YaaH